MTDRRVRPQAEARWGSRAAFRARSGPSQQAHPIAALPGAPAGAAGRGMHAVPARLAWVPKALAPEPGSLGCGERAAGLAAESSALPLERRLDKTGLAELVDSMGFPGQSCLWTPMYWVRVVNVFSCSLGHLLYLYPNTILAEPPANVLSAFTYCHVPGEAH